jgi:uncharacterized protein
MSTAVAAPPATGRFVWRDLMTTDPEKAKAFYGALFGWTTKPMDMGDFTYEILANGGEDFGGVVALDPSHGIPSHWISYIHVPSVDEACATAARLGGTVPVEPTDIPGIGRFAVIGDPQGAHFSPYTAAPSDDAPDDAEGLPPVGGVTWNELMTGDVEAAKAFYGEVIGWQFDDMNNEMSGYRNYSVLKQGERMDGGLMEKPEGVPGSFWTIYYRVSELEASLAEVARLGGQQMGPIIEVPTIGRLAWVTDPTGGMFALHEWAD